MMPNNDGWIQRLWAWADANHISSDTIPRNEHELAQLTSLGLSDNQLSSLPPELFNVTQLTVLDLDGNQLSSLPPEIGRLTQLTKLYLSYNQLSSLPPEIGRLRLTQLDWLNLSGNQFTKKQINELRQLLPKCNISAGNQQPVSAPSPTPAPDHYVTCVNCHSNIKNPRNNLCPSCGKHLYKKDTNVHCNACGSDYPAGEPYCPICGAGMPKQTAQGQQVANPNAPQASSQTQNTPKATHAPSPLVQASDDEEARLIAELEALKQQARIAELKKQIAESKAKLGL